MEASFFSKIKIFFKVNLFLKVKGLIILPLLTGYLGVLSYGVWSQFLVLIAFVQPLIMLGTDSAILRILPSIEENRRSSLIVSWFIISFALTIIFLSIFGFFFEYIVLYTFGSGWSEDNFTYFALCSINLMTINTLNILKSLLRFEGFAKELSRGDILKAILHIFLVSSVLILSLSVTELILLSILLDVVVLIYFIIIMRKKSYFSFNLMGIFNRDNLNKLKRLYSIALPFFPGAFLMWGINYVDRFFIVKINGLESAAAYAVSFTISYIPIQVIVNSIWYFYPSSASEYFEKKEFLKLEKLYFSSIALIVILITPIIFFFLKSSIPLIHLFANKDYMSAHLCIPILTLAYTISMLEAYSGTTLSLVYKHILSTVAITVAFLVNLIFNYYLIPVFGVVGAAISTLLAFTAQFVFSFLCSQKYSRLSFPWSFLTKSLFSSVLSYVFCMSIQDIFNFSLYYEFGIYVVFGLVIYILAMHLSGVRLKNIKLLIKELN